MQPSIGGLHDLVTVDGRRIYAPRARLRRDPALYRAPPAAAAEGLADPERMIEAVLRVEGEEYLGSMPRRTPVLDRGSGRWASPRRA